MMRKISIIFFFFLSVIFCDLLISQCTPPPSETCEDASVFCSLEKLNGYSCNNPSTTIPECQGLCACCPPYSVYRTWWSFIGESGSTSITLHVGACSNMPPFTGLVMGIWGDCHCTQQIACTPGCLQPGQSLTYQLNLEACKLYYLSIDACGNNICDFTINTVGGNKPNLSLGNINNNSNGVIGPVCTGLVDFFVNPTMSGCKPTYEWTFNGNIVGGNSNKISLDLSDPGDFIICVTGYLGNPINGSICDQEKKCALVKIKTAPPPREINYITCDNKPFIAPLGKSYYPCQVQLNIPIPNKNPLDCDSSLILNAVNVNLDSKWTTSCINHRVLHKPVFGISNPCNIGESYQFKYKWFVKSDSLKKVISTDDSLIVDAINQDYCVEVSVNTELGNSVVTCSKVYCDTINESNVLGSINNVSLYFCDSTLINGKIYYHSDTVTQHFNSASGCDSILNTIINITNSSNEEINISGCDSLIIDGQIYTQSTSINKKLINVFGCDSTIKTKLKITKSNSFDLALQGCDSLVINNQPYYQSGNYIQKLINSDNCDSTLNLNLTIGTTKNVDLKITSCDSIVIGGKAYYQSGKYPLVFQSIDLCDSLVDLCLTIFKTQRDSLFLSACDTVFYNGKIYTKTGDYPEFYIGASGCDSIINIHINITNSNIAPYGLKKCDSVTINGQYFDQSGLYQQHLISANGCDSTLNIDLTIGHKTSSSFKYHSCDSAFINTQWYYISGNYTQVIKNSNLCDSTINIDLSLSKSSQGDTIFRSCDSVIINGIPYIKTGIYQQILKNSEQCDSLLIINFTRLSKSSTNLKYKSCDTIMINGQMYSQSGLYSQTLSNANQCDSLLNLDITIAKSNSQSISLKGCDSILINGTEYYQTGSYTQDLINNDLCDSTLILNITINKSSLQDLNLRSCDSIRIGGKIFTQSTTITQFLKDRNQCDSAINTQIQIDKSIQSALSQSECDSIVINGKTYLISGQYTQNLKTNSGCDSTLILNLTIIPGNPFILDAGADTTICEEDVIKLHGLFKGTAKFNWFTANGSFDNPNVLSTNYYTNTIGDTKIYLSSTDDCRQQLDSLTIHVLPKQFVQITGDSIINPCKQNIFTASGGTNYKWIPSSLIECLDPACSRVLLKSDIASRFTISTDGPCSIPANLNITALQINTDIYVPNAFTPNGDNINDFFIPTFNCEQITNYNMQIFDRWGNLLFESNNKEIGWNGKSQDKPMNPGVYPYFVRYQVHGGERKIKAGEVTLIK